EISTFISFIKNLLESFEPIITYFVIRKLYFNDYWQFSHIVKRELQILIQVLPDQPLSFFHITLFDCFDDLCVFFDQIRSLPLDDCSAEEMDDGVHPFICFGQEWIFNRTYQFFMEIF